jgi:hypothetical protein
MASLTAIGFPLNSGSIVFGFLLFALFALVGRAW